MADYFTNISFAITMSEHQFQWLQSLHEANVERWDSWGPEEDREPIEVDDGIRTAYDALMEYDGAGLETLEYHGSDGAAWFHSCDANCDYVAALVQQFLIKFDINEPVSFEWSNDCSRPRTDAYGGGAFVITRDKVESISTCQWVSEALDRLTKEVANG